MGSALCGAGDVAVSTARLPSAFTPLVRLLAREEDITRDELGRELDRLLQTFYEHPASSQYCLDRRRAVSTLPSH